MPIGLRLVTLAHQLLDLFRAQTAQALAFANCNSHVEQEKWHRLQANGNGYQKCTY